MDEEIGAAARQVTAPAISHLFLLRIHLAPGLIWMAAVFGFYLILA
jgi:hypothetical protein